jgi:hypothetical protein
MMATCSGATAITPTDAGGGAPAPGPAGFLSPQPASSDSNTPEIKKRVPKYCEFMNVSHQKKVCRRSVS